MRTLSARDVRWSTLFGSVLVLRLLYPFFNSPLTHVFSDPQRHWDNAGRFLAPSVMGSGDPYMYQLWLFGLRQLADGSSALILSGCGALCAAMPYGWYRALRELMPRAAALRGAVLIGLWPPFLSGYAYFMTETLLLTLTGFGFAMTLRALRRQDTAAWIVACVVWFAAIFARIVVLPIAGVCLLWALLLQPHKLRALLLSVMLSLLLIVPAGMHGRASLGYFAPLGNLYLNEIYHAGNNKSIQIDFGRQGVYLFGSPSYYNPTFYPFSDWTSSRIGVLAITIDTRNGRADWRRTLAQMPPRSWSASWQDFAENLCYLLFGQSWPDNDRSSLVCWLSIWLRWLFVPIVLCVAIACGRGIYRGREWLLPVCALLALSLLAVQREGVMEGRYRKPMEPIFVAALVLAWHVRARPRERR
ncbi:MAG TPA: hypothetical protein VGP20_06340 [Steroidobacteraceae bacterium]|jgi:hypothetical protein|nr:hypothetical protein [Steroidobacteraceae bacterium]